MVVLKSKNELLKLKEAGRISAQALKLGGEAVKPGVSTWKIDQVIHDYIVSEGATPSFLNYGGFPASACISVNNEVIHGIPSQKRIIREGDIVSIDVGACKDGYHGDNAWTFAAGAISDEAKSLLETTEESLYAAIKAAVKGNRLGDVGYAVQSTVEKKGYGVVRDYVGHGVGRNLHEEPNVPNFGLPGHGTRLLPGMVIAIEPMINIKGAGVRQLSDGWTVVTASGSLSAHFEHTIAITEQGPVILTAL
ncbi:type I methionyl aminopeptidase [Candidatus Soleaferrea massiliensis]|uniref:type I methionyl aminopeptidase n=1 Tax=Candidatus Soleaferrea massiliensis TaxID=1470354 RepID=UPI00058E86D1|nr:type I methionyl aminopeptidase [Candidatus Soleaferrea massiliensis]